MKDNFIQINESKRLTTGKNIKVDSLHVSVKNL